MMMSLAKLGRHLLVALKWLAHPIVVFVGLQFVWLAITVMWVVWFVDSVGEMTKLTRSLGVPYLDNRYALAMLIGGCVLLGVLLVGTVVLFVFGQRQSYRNSQQKSFVSSVTHELRSPLASLQLSFETLRLRKLSDGQTQQLLAMAGQDLERLTRLVNQILVSARLDRGIIGIAEEPQEIILAPFITATCEQARWLDPGIAQRVAIACTPDLAVSLPPSVVALVLANLVENAIKYSPPATPIAVQVEASPHDVTIAVTDQGFGLSRHELKRIFRMFHRLPITRQKAIPGTGLGLFVVRSLVHNLGGKAWAVSPGPDCGSTFYVTLPRHLA